ncbi:Phytolongin Phyl1.1 like [Actinidia chinensis var. chinensis]|uniref:Phytolongin Phyl1.1 like n=1 Tax=Actinidia chinensis var. chinensis TaxID=1590841 RepID=A0A2R6R286_ACTCC|nr:Phytolongin Phyl1.1 like [Actinidia chinensis var. chinensis]
MLMASIQHTVSYCCVSKGGRTLYAYCGGDGEIENLASLCLEKTPPYHKWYFQTMGKKTFGFLVEDGYVYFAIVDEGLGNSGVLQFLEHVRDEFRKVAKKGSRRSISNLSSLCIEEQLVPVIHRLITSLENVSQSTDNDWPAEASSLHHGDLFVSPTSDPNGQNDAAASTKAPLLSKKEKKKMKDHVMAMRDIELEEHRRSTDMGTVDSNYQSGAVSSSSIHKDSVLMRTRSGTQNIRNKWCRQVRIVLAIDAAICLVLFVIWLIICGGTECLQ